MLPHIKFLKIFVRQNLFKSIISIAKNVFVQPPLFFAWVFSTTISIIGAILETFHRRTLKLCRPNNVIFENIPKFERHYYNNEVFLRVTNDTGRAEKNLLGRLEFEPATFGLLVRCSTNWATLSHLKGQL